MSDSHPRLEKGSRCKLTDKPRGSARGVKFGPEPVTKRGPWTGAARRGLKLPRQELLRPSAIAADTPKYVFDRTYERVLSQPVNDQAALDRVNGWVRANVHQIGPTVISPCHVCGHVGATLCEHHIAPVVPAAVDSVTRTKFGSYDMAVTNNHGLKHFLNEDLKDELIVKSCYNYITLHMQTSYQVNGQDRRDLRLAHCHRLMLRWLDTDQRLRRAVGEDTALKARCMMTVQRACDNVENSMLYAYTDPSRGFCWAWWLKLCVGLVLLLLLGWAFLEVLDSCVSLPEHAAATACPRLEAGSLLGGKTLSLCLSRLIYTVLNNVQTVLADLA